MYYPEPNEDDPGPVYIQEHGRLYISTVSSVRKKKRMSSSDTLQPEQPSLDHDIRSLRSLCLDYVAHNIHQVESLVGFPSIVGEELFQAVCQRGILQDWRNSLVSQILQTFTDSYHDEVLSSLSLSEFPNPLLEDCLPTLSLFTGLVKLDLTDQRLGDGHELLTSLSNLPTLTHLVLVNNALTDRGIQAMTSTLRMFQRGPLGLSFLNLACNPGLSDACIKYLYCYKDLTACDLSGTRITRSGIDQLTKKTSLTFLNSEDVEFEGNYNIVTEGWASTVLVSWMEKYTELQKDRDNHKPQNDKLPAKEFYMSRKTRLLNAQCVHDSNTKRPPVDPIIRLKQVTISKETGSTDLRLPAEKGGTDHQENRSHILQDQDNSKKKRKQKRFAMSEVLNLCTNKSGSDSCDSDSEQSHALEDMYEIPLVRTDSEQSHALENMCKIPFMNT